MQKINKPMKDVELTREDWGKNTYRNDTVYVVISSIVLLAVFLLTTIYR